MGDTVTTLQTLMAEKFSPIVSRSYHNEQILLMMLGKVTADEINQRGGKYPIQTLRQGSFQGGSESQSMPTAVNGEYKDWVPALKAIYSTGEFSGFAHWQTNILTAEGQANKLKIGGMLGEKIKSHTDEFGYFLDQTFFRDGKGKLADAIAARTTGVGGTVTVTPSTANWPVDEIPIGARVNFYTSAGTIHNATKAVSTVTAVNPTTGVVTFDEVASDCAVGDFMVWEGSWDFTERLGRSRAEPIDHVSGRRRNELSETQRATSTRRPQLWIFALSTASRPALVRSWVRSSRVTTISLLHIRRKLTPTETQATRSTPLSTVRTATTTRSTSAIRRFRSPVWTSTNRTVAANASCTA
jgi:hypothetical protein